MMVDSQEASSNDPSLDSNASRKSLGDEGQLSSCSGSESAYSTDMRFAFWLPSDASLEDGWESESEASQSLASSSRSCYRDAMETSPTGSFTSCLSSQARSTVTANSCVSQAFGGLQQLSQCSQLVCDIHDETGMAISDLLELDRTGILAQIPRNAEGEITSVGSITKHMDGTCSPCIFWFKGKCPKLVQCSFCHFRHPGQKARRQKSNKVNSGGPKEDDGSAGSKAVT
eukprot:TRINITY_DN60130_c0_g1_i1.p1 TRINITY_DN60130_c0_g1~~TRINITY_DN60130_c0_g1_i1.p1  ORF type:complete len:229 (-),score=27.53 TRINITY_DN60130_c0_g1_i1:11-697(-)